MTYETRTMSLIVLKEGNAIFEEGATTVGLVDKFGGEFVVVSQDDDDGEYGKIGISPEEWPMLRDAIDRMIAECRL